MAEFERRLRWRVAPLLFFLAMMVVLAGVAAVSLLAPRRTVSGIPGDTDAQAAVALMRGQAPAAMGALRFHSELTGEAVPGDSGPFPATAAEARELLARAQARRPLDARLPAAIAHLDLAQRKLASAERGYRGALILAPHYGEARLGLGVALVLRAEGEADPFEQRSLRLQAVAQFAAVKGDDPVYAHALYDRAVLLARVNRRAEAENHANEYLRRYGGDAWAESLPARLDPGR